MKKYFSSIVKWFTVLYHKYKALTAEVKISTLAFIVSFCSIVISVWQLRVSQQRAKSDATMTYFTESINTYHPILFGIKFKYGVAGIKTPLTDEMVLKIEQDSIYEKDINLLLTFLETMATGVNEDVYDINIANKLLGERIVDAWFYLKPYVCDQRIKGNYPKLYDQIEILAVRLKNIREKEKNNYNNTCTKVAQ